MNLSRGTFWGMKAGLSKKKKIIITDVGGGASPDIDLTNSVFIIFDIGQSNSIGRGTAQRIIQLTTDVEIPAGVKIYNKPSGATHGYSLAADGAFFVTQEGSPYTREPDQAAISVTGAYNMLANRLRKVSPNTVYIVPVGDGGTALKAGLSTPDWFEGATNENFDIAIDHYYSPAYIAVEAENPGKTIVPIIMWHQGESDADDADGITGYATRFGGSGRFVDSLRAAHPSLSEALLIITKLYYSVDAAEATINAAFQAYADANPSLVKIIDISGFNRKVDMTADEKGGIATASNDDEHTSYLGQQSKADQAYAHIKTKYFPSVDDSEITTYTNFDTSTLGTTGISLEFTRSKMTFVDTLVGKRIVSSCVNDFSLGGAFSTVVGDPRFKLYGRKGVIETLAGTTPRIQNTTAIGSSLIDGSFSLHFWCKPRDGQPPTQMAICHDVQNTAAPNNSRMSVIILTNGKIEAFIAVGGTIRIADTANAIFTDAVQLEEKHIAITFTNGGLIRIYVNGVLQTLDVTNNGDISALNLANYVNVTNVFTTFAQRTGASTYGSHYFGTLRKFEVHTGVVYSQSDINNLMLN